MTSQACQTESSETKENYCQCPDVSSKDIQTDSLNNVFSIKQYNVNEIKKFLSYAIPITVEAIRENDYFPWNTVYQLKPRLDSGPYINYSFTNPSDLLIEDKDSSNNSKNLKISAITWNCSSSVLAIGHSVPTHNDWCSHESPIIFYNLLCRDKSKRHSKVDLPSCVSCISGHPNQSSIFVVGCVSGRVLVIDLSTIDVFSTVSSAQSERVSHEDRVTSLLWISGDSGNRILLSLGLDGRVFVWKCYVKDSRHDLSVIQAFAVSIEDLHKGLSYHKEKSLSNSTTTSFVGVYSSAVVPTNEKKFIVGCVAGGLFLCSYVGESRWQTSTPMTTSNIFTHLPSPVVVSYVGHRSTISNIDFHPSRRNLFMSSSVDGELRVYTLLESKPLAIIHLEVGIENAFWMKDDDNVIICRESSGHIRSIQFSNEIESNHKLLLVKQKSKNVFPNTAHLLSLNPFETTTQIAFVMERDNDVQLWQVK